MRRFLLTAALLAMGGAVAAQQQGAGSAPPGARGGPPAPAPKPVTLASRPGATGGEALYVEHCASCHAANGMGTGLLARRVQPALLEMRDNLPAAYVTVAVRQGIGNMPAIPRGEVGDDELRQIAEYLAAGPHETAP
jgi:mono/diheme cytochrome c family protein